MHLNKLALSVALAVSVQASSSHAFSWLGYALGLVALLGVKRHYSLRASAQGILPARMLDDGEPLDVTDVTPATKQTGRAEASRVAPSSVYSKRFKKSPLYKSLPPSFKTLPANRDTIYTQEVLRKLYPQIYSRGLKVYETGGSGQCFFFSLAFLMREVGARQVHIPTEKRLRLAQELRNLAVKRLKADEEKQGFIEGLQDASAAEKAAYFRERSQFSNYADFPLIAALVDPSDAQKMNMIIFKSKKTTRRDGEVVIEAMQPQEFLNGGDDEPVYMIACIEEHDEATGAENEHFQAVVNDDDTVLTKRQLLARD